MDSDIRPGTVLVASDGSLHADRAVQWAADQADLEGRALTVVVVGDDGHLVRDRAVGLARETHPDLDITGVLRQGDPRLALLHLSTDAHLLVLGSRGRGVLRSALLGSVSAAVSAHAACPTVVCRPVPDHPGRSGVLVGADGSAASRPVLEHAYRFASLRGLDLTVLHTFWDAMAAVAAFRQAQGRDVVAPELDELRALLAESVAGLAETFPDVPVTLQLEHGLADEALAPRDRVWDLVVVGRHPMTTLDRVVSGSIATTVVERSRSTVLVVPESA